MANLTYFRGVTHLDGYWSGFSPFNSCNSRLFMVVPLKLREINKSESAKTQEKWVLKKGGSMCRSWLDEERQRDARAWSQQLVTREGILLIFEQSDGRRGQKEAAGRKQWPNQRKFPGQIQMKGKKKVDGNGVNTRWRRVIQDEWGDDKRGSSSSGWQESRA